MRNDRIVFILKYTLVLILLFLITFLLCRLIFPAEALTGNYMGATLI